MMKLSVIVPVYQNADNLGRSIPYYAQFLSTLNVPFELICVDDGSTDRSYEILSELRLQIKELKVIKLVRNFGQAAAIYAGLSIAQGEAQGIISADMQDPIELFGPMYRDWEKGKKVCVAARKDRLDTGLNVFFAKIYNRMLQLFINPKYPPGGFDFFLIDKEVSQHLLAMSEKESMIQVLLLWLGYDFSKFEYTRMERVGGKSQWTFWKRFKLVVDTVTANSYLPLRGISLSGILFSVFSIAYSFYAFVTAIWYWWNDIPVQVPGWSSIAVLISFCSGLILLSLGIIGEYVWRIFVHIKKRPVFLIEEKSISTEK